MKRQGYLRIIFVSLLFLLFFDLQGYSGEGKSQIKGLYNMETLKKMMDKGPISMIDDTVPLAKEDSRGLIPVTTGAIINASPKQVFETITDYENLPSIVPAVAKTKITKKTNNSFTVYHKVVIVDLPIGNVSTNYTLKSTWYENKDGSYFIDISWVEGKVKDLKASWELIPIDNDNKTMAFYTARGNYRKAAGGPFGAAITNYIFGKQPELEKAVTFSANLVLVDAIKKEAEKRARN